MLSLQNAYIFVTKKLTCTTSNKKYHKLIHGGPDLVDSASLTMNPTHRSPSTLEKDDPGSISLVAHLFWAQNTLRFEAIVATTIDKLKSYHEEEGEGAEGGGLAAEGEGLELGRQQQVVGQAGQAERGRRRGATDLPSDRSPDFKRFPIKRETHI
jgi:hypothetical protein